MTVSRRLPLLLIPATLFLIAIYVWPSLGLFRNAFNEEYFELLAVQSGNTGLVVGQPADARTGGVTFRTRF